MPEENKASGRVKEIVRRIRGTLMHILSPILALSLIGLAIIEALLAPALGVRWAIFSLATAACAVGLFLGVAGLAIDFLGSWAAEIHGQLVSLHDEEVKKLSQSQQRAAPTRTPASWRN